MVGPSGLEPPTSRLSGVRSNQLSYGPFGAGEGNRTLATSLEGWSSTIELHPHFLFKWSGRQDLNLRPSGPKPDALPSCATSRNGVPGETRTPNLLIRSQTLYPIELRAHYI
jgi:hypothetical protein